MKNSLSIYRWRLEVSENEYGDDMVYIYEGDEKIASSYIDWNTDLEYLYDEFMKELPEEEVSLWLKENSQKF